jgi:tetrahydromethanopterin S-methyltransferase subunit G
VEAERRISRLEGAYEQVDARLHDLAQSLESTRAELNSRINTLTVIVVGSWVTIMLAIIGLYFAK